MARKIGLTFAIVTLASAAYLAGAWRAPRATVRAAGAEAPRRLLFYRCPMHPDVRSDVPGQAPCCGMAFEPVYSHAAPGALVVTARQREMIGLRTIPAEAAGGAVPVRAFGRVVPDETRVRRLSAGLDAYISDIATATTGSYVHAGQWLASFSTPEARAPISAYITTVNVLEREEGNGSDTAALAAARASLALAVERLLTLGMSPLQIDEIRRDRRPTSTVRLTSPVNGFVLARPVVAGQRFGAGTELFTIVDLDRVWIVADLPAAEGAHVTPGTAAQVSIGGTAVGAAARVSSRVLPQFDAATQSLKVRIEADNPRFALRPDMFVDVDLEVPLPRGVLVPAESVLVTGRRSHVFVESPPGVFEPRAVEVGGRYHDRLLIVSGLSAGDRVVRSGTFLLDSESRMSGR